jgi:hypothetical protein
MPTFHSWCWKHAKRHFGALRAFSSGFVDKHRRSAQFEQLNLSHLLEN